jgi:tricorn protease
MHKIGGSRMQFMVVLAGLLLTGMAALSAPEATPLLLRNPTLSRTSIVFAFAGDLWSVPRDGGEARRLTVGPGFEGLARFSPDGSQIAFTGEYDGNTDVFAIPAEGGVPRRLTWHPEDDVAAGWTPDGKRVLFLSHRASGTDALQLFTIALDGSFPDQIPLPVAGEASYSPDGSHLAYVPIFQWQQAWKRYRGGQTLKIWIADLSNSAVIEIPRQNSNDFNPMWAGDQIYFLSDRNGPVTLFAYDTRTRQVKQLIENKGYDFKSASAGPGAIVYEQFGSLHTYDLKTGQTKTVDVKLAGDLPELRPHYVKVAKRLENADISPNGARAVFEARGEILTVPAEKGDPRNLTNSASVHEREPAWSPDGKFIAYFSDESGEYEMHIRAQDGMGEVRKISLGSTPQFYMVPRWSPDSRKIAYLDNHTGLWYIDLETKKPVKVDQDYFRYERNLTPAWSPDSKWLAYAKTLKSGLSAINLYSLASTTITQVTDGMGDAGHPVFSRNGKYLYFVASTNSGPAGESDLQSAVLPTTSNVYLIVLSKDEKSPLAPESDEEKPADEKKTNDNEKSDIKVDFDNISQRILALPLPSRRYVDLQFGKSVVLALETPTSTPKDPPVFNVQRYDFAKRKADTPFTGLSYFKISFSGDKVLYARDGHWTISELPSFGSSNPNVGALKTEDLEVRVDPAAEWNQMYREVWRIERDYFYDPNYHGLDLKATEQKYAPFVAGVASRDDLNYLFTEMLGEMTVGHIFIGGGDSPETKKVTTGLLGADYKTENGRYRFARVYNGENWNPDLNAPLTQPGVNVAAGDYLLGVNGRELQASDNVYSFFEATADKSTVLTVGADPSGAGSRRVTVVPIPNENRLRYLAWIEDNRRKVDQLTNGRVAYIHMPDTSFDGYQSFMRYFYAQVGKDAAIIDERFNHGGHLATDIIEFLQRRLMSVISFRDGADTNQPFGAILGPKVMIINEFAGSGGDAMPWYFKRAGVGKLVGERTWGGLVGLSGFSYGLQFLMDGGVVTAPNAAIWNPNGQFDVENRGVTPDIEVPLDPAAVRQGHDPQLERAIQVVMEELQKNPPAQPKRPPYPNYH